MEEDHLEAGLQLWEPLHCLPFRRHTWVHMCMLLIGNPKV